MPWTIKPLVTARMAAEAGRLTFLRNYGTKIWLPSLFYLLTGGPQPVLVDTSGQAEVMSKMRTEPVEPVAGFAEALATEGFTPEDIKLVIHTHLMYDHCANSKNLKNAKFVVQKKELAFALDPHPMFAGVYQRELFEGLPFIEVEGDQEILPGISVLLTPGHTPGAESVMVDTKEGRTIITGFCCLAENFTAQKSPAWVTDRAPEVVPSGIHTDMLATYDSMVRVKGLADFIIPFHDPDNIVATGRGGRQ